jgi:Domain of unknown function (DUF4082)
MSESDSPGVGNMSFSRELSRRKIFRGAVTVAAAGAAGGGVLAQTRGSTAHAAQLATTVEQGAVAPAVVSLADGSTIAVDASLGNDYRVTIAGDRTMATPTNPTDGQKITLQVTQGTGGSYTITWGTGYEFSTGLPQPTLSTAVGDTDLLGFVYNSSLGKWLLAGFVSGFASAPVVTPPSGTYRLFPTTNGPSSPASYGGPFTCGIVWEVTVGGCWLDGYWWWVCAADQSTSPQEFALWQIYNGDDGTLVSGSAVTSGTLTPGQWNFVSLSTPIPLTIGAIYVAATGFTGSFPDTDSQFGGGETYGSGIVNGPLTAFSDASGSNPSPFGTAQGVFTVAGSDPTVDMPIYGSASNNFWIDLQVDTNPPAGTSYRLWPNYPTVPGVLDSDTLGYTLATEFQLSDSCGLDNIWFYSAPGATVLPTSCAIWDVASQTVVAGTYNTSPAWSGSAGGGWVGCPYSGLTLPAGDYKVAVFYGGGEQWYLATTDYWASGGVGGKGITTGPVTAPSNSAATSPGQSSYNTGSWAYPGTSADGNGENFWVDVEVTPS